MSLDKKEEEWDKISEEVSPVINYQNCSWQKTAGLLFSEYICLAIMSFPWSYSVLGLVPGLILTVGISLTCLYTGCIITDYCITYPGITSVCDVGQHIFWNSRFVWYATAVMFICNNTLISALHVLVGAKYFSTITDNFDGGKIYVCQIAFAVLSGFICFLFSLPRTFSSMSAVAYVSAGTMFVAVVLSMAFAGVQSHPAGYDGTPVEWNLWPAKGTTFVQGMSAMLNIVYTFVGQITYPSFISQMKKPKEFKKALWVVTLCELITFALAGSVVYVYVGNKYMTAPAFGSLVGNYKKIAYSFALPTILFLGSLYSNVTSQWIFLMIFREGNKNREDHTVLGWSVWIGLNAFIWVIAFVIAEVIPFFSDLLSLMSSLFDCWFGFVFWGVAFFRLRKHQYPKTGFWQLFKEADWLTKIEFFINIVLIVMGIYIMGPGLYAVVQSIILSYQSGAYGHPFECTPSVV
ncbi:hypothetical protein FDK38_004797 [Candidozyma auris]|nr:hypothetical protein FDK38_004797 [[Candida] auris]